MVDCNTTFAVNDTRHSSIWEGENRKESKRHARGIFKLSLSSIQCLVENIMLA